MKEQSRQRPLGTSILISLLSATAVGWFVWLDLERVSPGALARSHTRVDELASNRGCMLCHGEDARGMAGACLECHTPIDAQITAGSGLHGGLEPGQACAACHAEHHGEDFPIVSNFSFALAGADSAAFDHGHTEFGLAGRHTTLGCDACHPHALAGSLAEGETRFLGQSQRCDSCHEDAHNGEFGNDCAQCHGQEHSFPEAPGFDHRPLALRGAHETDCRKCHGSESSQDVASLVAFLSQSLPLQARSCQDCHQSPHSLAWTEGSDNDCAQCHDAERDAFHGTAARLDAGQHADFGFPLLNPHDGLECQQCHQDWGHAKDTVAFALSYPGRSAEACHACHGDPHDGQFRAATLGRQCLDCHEPHRFAPSRIDVQQHARVYPLEHAHAQLECQACHSEQAGVQRFAGIDPECASCHEGPHGGQFRQLGETGRTVCAACHSTETFAFVEGGPEFHARLGFPLSAPHAQADCAQCHRKDPLLADATRFRGTSQQCASCHQDPHDGQFQQADQPADCRGCHGEVHFLPPRFDFVAHEASGFPLEGVHQAVACNLCHTREDGAARRFAGTPSGCADCHQDPHGGIFAEQPTPTSDGCARCHSSAGFSQSAGDGFDHKWTGYALEGAHARAACAACHAPRGRPDELGRGYHRAAGTRCQDCHAEPHAGQFGNPAEADCRRCHQSSESFGALRFDHNRDARFALDATHENLSCAACHQPTALEGGGQAIRYRPMGRNCADCHSTGRNE